MPRVIPTGLKVSFNPSLLGVKALGTKMSAKAFLSNVSLYESVQPLATFTVNASCRGLKLKVIGHSFLSNLKLPQIANTFDGGNVVLKSWIGLIFGIKVLSTRKERLMRDQIISAGEVGYFLY